MQTCQEQIRDVQERNQEVLAINATLRDELGEARREIETCKEQLRQRDEASHTAVVGDANLAQLPQKEPAHITGVSKVGAKKGRGHKRGKKEGKE
jgi:hypothetical protein